jgi:predicted dehydrogenase
MEPVRWGVLGVANIFAHRVLPPMQRLKVAELRAVASRSAQKAKQFAEERGIPGWYGSYEELLADPKVEAVYIPLPNHLHAPWIAKAASAGKHILCEKPLALNAAEAAACVEQARQGGVRLMEAFMYRFHPQWRRVWELARVGEVGALHEVHTFFAYTNTDAANIRNKADMGGGGLMDIGCYAVSVPRWLFGQEPRRVISLVRRDPKLEVDILASAILEFPSGRSVFTVGTQLYPGQRVELHGSEGIITVWLPFNIYPDVPVRVTVQTSIGERELYFEARDQYALEIEAFSLALRENRPVPTPPEDAVHNQKVLDALFRSEKSGRWEEP